MRLILIAMICVGGAIATGPAAVTPASAQQIPARPPAEPSALMQFPGSGWWLAPPPGFVQSSPNWPVLRHRSGAHIALVEFAKQPLTHASFGAIGALTAAGTQDEGRLESVEAVMAGGRPAFLVTARLTQQKALAYSLIVEGARQNVGVTLTVPDAATDIDLTAIRAALLSVTDRIAEAQARPVSDPALASVRFPGTSWSIVPPEGFALDGTSPEMFRHPSGAVIMLFEQPRETINAQEFKIGVRLHEGTQNESRVEHVEPLSWAGRPAVLVRLRMPRRALLAHVMLVEGQDGNVMAQMQVPDTAAFPDAAAIRASLLSVTETRRSPEQRLGDLPFRLTELAGMRVVSIIANSVVILTDGPGDLMDVATDQPFALLSLYPIPPRERFDATRDLPKMAALVRERYPGATILTQKVEPTPQGPVASVVFTRTPPGKTAAVAGVAWALVQGGSALFMVGQFPPERSDLPARFVKVRNGVKPR